MANRIATTDLPALNELLATMNLTMPDKWFSERYNIAPLSAVWLIHLDTATLRLSPAQWGLIPPWAKPGQFERPLTHARAETVWEKTSFKHLVKRYRATVICNGFYVFTGRGTQACTHYVAAKDASAIGLAAIWQYNVDGNIETTVINTDAGRLARSLKSRVPIVLQPTQVMDWITTDQSKTVNQILGANADDNLIVKRVSNRVRDPLNEGALCIEDDVDAQRTQ